MKASYRFLFGTLLFSLAVVLGIGLWMLHRASQAEWARFETMMEQTDRLVQAEMRDLLWNLDANGVQAHADRTFEEPEVVRVRILDPAGVATVSRMQEDVPHEQVRLRRFEIRQEGRLLAEVEMGYTTALVQARIRHWRSGLLCLIGALGVMLLAADFELRRMVWRPLARFTADVRAGQRGDSSAGGMAAEVRECVEAFQAFADGEAKRKMIDRRRVETLEKQTAELQTDIREREAAEAAQRQAQKMEALARISGGVGAEFNNLLTSILGFSAMARDQLKPNKQAYADIEEVLHAGERARTLTQQLLSLGRCRQLELRKLPVRELLDDLAETAQEHAGPAITVEAHFDTEKGYLLIDEPALKQVFAALAANARESMPKGGRVTIESKETFLDQEEVRHLPDLDPGSYVLISFIDTGVGMTAEVREQAMEPFFTTRGPTHTGLGLSTAHGIIRQCKGNLEIYSERGRGTQVLVYLPLHTADAAEIGPPQKSETTGAETVRGTETVLVVEDEESVRHMSRRLLEAQGYTVLDANDGDVGIQVAADFSEPIHLILSDVVMPTLNGPDMISKIRETRPDCRVLYMSGFAETRLPDIDESGRAVNLMLKPFTREILYRRIREVLDDDTPPAPV